MSKKMREEFEAGAAPYGYVLIAASCPCCTYADDATENRWKGWQASRAQSDAELHKDVARAQASAIKEHKRAEELQREIAKRDAIIAMQADALKEAEKCINTVWVSHQANRCDAALAEIKSAISASAESVAAWEAKKLESYEWMWSRCKIIFFPKADDKLGTYPIEHNPFARKDGRMFIEAKMKAELRAQSAQTKE